MSYSCCYCWRRRTQMPEEYRPWTWKIPEGFTPVEYSTPRHDAHDKLSGQGLYTRDLNFPGMLCAKILTSPYAHARIVSMDTRKAEALGGSPRYIEIRRSGHSAGKLHRWILFQSVQHPHASPHQRLLSAPDGRRRGGGKRRNLRPRAPAD